jgi:hypothetical protein
MKLPDNPTDDQIDDFNNRQLFVRDAMPSSWLSYAEELEEAAEALWADSDNRLVVEAETQLDRSLLVKKSSTHSRSYILLAGLALENVLKGLIIAGDAKLISSGRLDKTLKSHKLLDLAKRIDGLVLSKDEKHVLQICQYAIPYWGRYPIPLEYQGLQPRQAANDKFRTCFRQLHFRLCKWLYDLLKDGWDSGVGPGTLKMRSIRYGDTIDPKEKFPWANDDES